MARVHVFTDEAGNFDFRGSRGATKYYVTTSVTMRDFAAGDALLRLRRQLAWEGHPHKTPDFHATEELQAVRDRVFDELASWDFWVDATVIDKANVPTTLSANEVDFYHFAWLSHFERVALATVLAGDELLVMSASLGTNKRRQTFHRAVSGAVAAAFPLMPFRTVSWAAASDPCLWVADFCCWAIQRKWERSDARSHVLIESKIRSEVLIVGEEEGPASELAPAEPEGSFADPIPP